MLFVQKIFARFWAFCVRWFRNNVLIDIKTILNTKNMVRDLLYKYGLYSNPRDNKLMSLLTDAYREDLVCYKGWISVKDIKPLTNFKPKIRNKDQAYYLSQLAVINAPIVVYRENNKFIMSDDYELYYKYMEVKKKRILAYILGNCGNLIVKYKIGPVRLPPPDRIHFS